MSISKNLILQYEQQQNKDFSFQPEDINDFHLWLDSLYHERELEECEDDCQ